MIRNRLPVAPPQHAVDTIRRVMSTQMAQDWINAAEATGPEGTVALVIMHPDTPLHGQFTRQMLSDDRQYWEREIAEQAQTMRSIGLPSLLVMPWPAQVLLAILERMTPDHAQRAAWRGLVEQERFVVCLAGPEGLLVVPLASRQAGVN